MPIRVVALGLLLVLSGCAVGEYRPPAVAPKKDNERVVAMAFDEAWKRLIDHASQTFFVIDNVAKESGLLTLSFGADNPSRFIDCGTVKAASTAGPGAGYAGPYAVYASMYLGGTLTGKMNLLLQKVSETETKVRVAARYIFQIPSQANFPGSTWSFDSGGAQTIAISNAMMGTEPTRTCQATGLAESEILRIFE